MGCLLSVGTGAWKKEQNCVSQIEYPQKNYKAYTSAGPRLLLDPKSAIMWVLGEKKKYLFLLQIESLSCSDTKEMVSCDSSYFLSESRVLSPQQSCVNTCPYFMFHSK